MASEPEPITSAQWVRWPDENLGPWEIWTYWGWAGGRLECIGVALWHGASPDPQLDPNRQTSPHPLGSYRSISGGPYPILASDVRAIPLAGIVQRVRDEYLRSLTDSLLSAEHARSQGESIFTVPGHQATDEETAESVRYEQLLAQAVKSLGDPRPGRGRKRELGPEVLATTAQVYLAAWARSEPPTKAVAAHFSVSISAAAKRVAAARKAGLLGPTTAGKPSGPAEPPAPMARPAEQTVGSPRSGTWFPTPDDT